MPEPTRRSFLTHSGLAAAGLASLRLRDDALPTAASGLELPPQDKVQTKARPVTEPNIEGPFFRAGSPHRAKISPPLAEGRVTLIRGRVWGHDTKKPLAAATIHIWQADHAGRYDNDDPKHPPRSDVFRFRARMRTDEVGRYEFETIHPGRYLNGDTYRPAHIHYRVEAPGYRTLVTQLYFAGDPYNAKDRFIRESLIIEPKPIRVDAERSYQLGVFDIVLAKS